MSELNDRQAACIMAIEEVRSILKEVAEEDQISLTAFALEMYLLAMAMKQEYWTTAMYMADQFCRMAELNAGEVHREAMTLYLEKREEIEEERNGK